MSSTRSVAASGLVALLIGLSVIALVSLSGVPPVRVGSTSQATNSGGGQLTTSTFGSGSNTVSTETTTTSSAGQQSSGQGVLSILLTDPPEVPSGVTAVYVYYIGLAVHGQQGWTTLKEAGAIELMGTVNVAQTLSSATLPPGVYDSIRFEVASAQVTYQGVNHTAIVQGGQLTIRILGGAVVSASQAAGALIDIRPIVINVGTTSSPEFVLWAGAWAFQVPTGQVTTGLQAEGHRISLKGLGWWYADELRANATLQISGASLNSNSLSIGVSDVGSSGTFLKIVVVSAQTPGGEEGGNVPSVITSSAVFIVLANGTLVQFIPLLHAAMPDVRGESQGSVLDALVLAGYNLTAGSTAHLSYSGSIQLSFGLLSQPQGITSGDTYRVTVVGIGSVTSTVVTAA